jgi:HK97 family phage prohead protease
MRSKVVTSPFEIKSISADGQIEGYASVFGNVDSYNDVVMPGAFVKSLTTHQAKNSMPAMLWQHRSDQPLGSWSKMEEDAHGLHAVGQLCLDTYRGREVRALMKMTPPAVRGLSIGFSIPNGGETFDHEANVNRLTEVDLWETSVVTFPANDQANVEQVRSQWLADRTLPPGMLDEILSSARAFERFLREVGLPKPIAKKVASKLLKVRTNRREAGDDISPLSGLLGQIKAST